MRGEALCAAIAAAMRMKSCNSASRFGPRAASKMLTLQRYRPSVQASNESYRCRVEPRHETDRKRRGCLHCRPCRTAIRQFIGLEV
jgi:ribosomal protein L37AE/L43A